MISWAVSILFALVGLRFAFQVLETIKSGQYLMVALYAVASVIFLAWSLLAALGAKEHNEEFKKKL